MAATGARNDPFLAFRYQVQMGDLPVAGFSECGGLQLETEVQDYMQGGLNTHVLKFPTRTKQSNLVLKRGIVDRKLWQWYADVVKGVMTFRGGSIVVFDPSGGETVMTFEFDHAFPCKWIGPALNAAQNSVAVETLELCHHGLIYKS